MPPCHQNCFLAEESTYHVKTWLFLVHFKQQTLNFTLDLSFPTFHDFQKKIRDMVLTNWMHVPIDQRSSKTKIIGCLDLRFGVGESVGAQQVTLSISLKFELLMGINRSCVKHIALDNSP